MMILWYNSLVKVWISLSYMKRLETRTISLEVNDIVLSLIDFIKTWLIHS